MKRKILTLTALLLFVLCFTACATVERELTINKDGSMSTVFGMSAEESTVALAYDSPDEFYQSIYDSFEDILVEIFGSDDFDINYGNSSGYCYIFFSGDIPKGNEQNALEYMFDGMTVIYDVTGFANKKITITLKNDNPSDSYSGSAYLIDDIFTIITPTELLASNGDKEYENAASWDLSTLEFEGGKKRMYVEYKDPRISGIITLIAICGGLFLLAVIVLIIVLAARSSKKKSAAAAAAGQAYAQSQYYYQAPPQDTQL